MREPLFSIIIPTYNRTQRLTTCVESLTKLNFPRENFEVIVVDDGSKQPLDAAIAPFREKLNLTLIKQENAGPAAARNKGATSARGEYLVFTDDDCTLAPDWLSNAEVYFAQSPNCTIGGRTINALPNNIYSTASQILIDYLYAYFNTNSQQSNFFASNNFAIRAQIFHSLGGFDTSFPLAAGEDREFCDRLLHRGEKMIYAPEARIYHAHELSLRKFWRQHFNYGRGAFCFHQLRAKRQLSKIKVEPFSFYWNLLTYPFKQTSVTGKLKISALLFLSQVANVTGFFWEKFQKKLDSTNKLKKKEIANVN